MRIFTQLRPAKCALCGESSLFISEFLGVCGNCIKTKWDESLLYIKRAHKISRERFNLPLEPPSNGVSCDFCVNKCKIPLGGVGYCGLRMNEGGRLKHIAGTPEIGILEWYYDPLPTNCVANEICPGCAGTGYPKYSYSQYKPEYGYKNLAVFYGACTFNCLFCQNWHYRYLTNKRAPSYSARELASKVDPFTSCICYFGGDPTPQLPHAIQTSKIALEENKNKILRICFESNGSMSRSLCKQIAELSLTSGGNIKFDLKSYDEHLNIALCGVTNKQTLENFQYLAEFGKQRREPRFLTASTLLIPGYIDASEVEQLAKFIASLDPEIPYSLLAFYPQFFFTNLPTTPRKQAEECLEVARKAGLKTVWIGNIHLLS
ncbi:MAG: radical SAM protein [Methanocellales archaeon]